MIEELVRTGDPEKASSEYNPADLVIFDTFDEISKFVMYVHDKGRNDKNEFELTDREVVMAHDLAVTVVTALSFYPAFSEKQRDLFLRAGGPYYVEAIKDAIAVEVAGNASRNHVFVILYKLCMNLYQHRFL